MRNTLKPFLVVPFLALPALADSAPSGVGQLALPAGHVAWNAASAEASQLDVNSRFFLAVADTSGIGFEHVWARPTAGAATSGAIYFTVTNQGSPDELVGASTPVAAIAAVHETINDQGVMKMRPVPSVVLEPGKPVTLKPGGYHVMLTGLKGALKPGDSFPLTLTFVHAQPITVTAKVETMSGAAMDHGAAAGMH
jgi:copper(I)-binding protein